MVCILFHTEPNAVVDPNIESSSTDVINLTWTKPEGDMTGYRIDYLPIKDSEAASDDDQDKPEGGGQDGVAEGKDKPRNEEEKVDVLNEPSEDNANQSSVDKDTNNQDKPNDSEVQTDKPGNDEDAESKSTSIDGGETTKAEVTGLVPGQSYQFSIITMSGEEGSEAVTIKGTTSKYTF